MTAEFADRHVVITGSTGGLGRAVVAELISAGATCHLPCVESSVPDELGWADQERIQVETSVDLTDEDAVSRFYEARPAIWASIHLVGGFAMAPIADTTVADLQKMWSLNAVTCFACSRAAVLSMRKGGQGGRILNVTARPALQPAAGMIAYAISKAAVASLTRSLATELHVDNILVNAIVPSIIDTQVNRQAMPQADFNSWPKAAQVAESIRFLVSPHNQLTSGSLVPVYGHA